MRTRFTDCALTVEPVSALVVQPRRVQAVRPGSAGMAVGAAIRRRGRMR